MQLQDKLVSLLVNPDDKAFKSISDENLSEFKELLKGKELEDSMASNGKSILLELLPRGQKKYARELANQIQNLTIFEAAGLAKIQIIKKLLQVDPDLINQKSSLSGMSPLHLASGFSESPETVQILLDNHADIHQFSVPSLIDGLTPIIAAALGGSYGILEMLLKAGADPNSQEIKSKTTALHITTAHQRLEHTKLLLSYGANPTLETLDRRSSLDNVRKSNNEDLKKLFIDYFNTQPN